VVTGVVVAITLLALTPLLYHLPQATLAAVIIMAVINLVKVDPIKHAWKVQRHDAAVAVITFVLTIIWVPHLDKGIMVGVMLSLMLFLYRSMAPRVAVLSRDPDGIAARCRRAQAGDLQEHITGSLRRVAVFRQHRLFRGQGAGTRGAETGSEFVIIDAEGINEIDATVEEILHHLVGRLQEVGSRTADRPCQEAALGHL